MSILTDKISEVYDDMIAANNTSAVWRGILSDGTDWKIGIEIKNYEVSDLVTITARKRNIGE